MGHDQAGDVLRLAHPNGGLLVPFGMDNKRFVHGLTNPSSSGVLRASISGGADGHAGITPAIRVPASGTILEWGRGHGVA